MIFAVLQLWWNNKSPLHQSLTLWRVFSTDICCFSFNILTSSSNLDFSAAKTIDVQWIWLYINITCSALQPNIIISCRFIYSARKLLIIYRMPVLLWLPLCKCLCCSGSRYKRFIKYYSITSLKRMAAIFELTHSVVVNLNVEVTSLKM